MGLQSKRHVVLNFCAQMSDENQTIDQNYVGEERMAPKFDQISTSDVMVVNFGELFA